MPVTFKTSTNPPREWTEKPITDPEQLLKAACNKPGKRMKRVIQSSFNDISDKHMCANKNGFVNATYRAYSFHHHLRIRPEDVWFSILTQLSFYINANAEKLRTHFVSHEGQKKLTVTVEGGNIDSVDHGWVATMMTGEMQKHIVDKELQQWILPDFTTTVVGDVVTAAVIMMGSMQKYFSYETSITCGIPSRLAKIKDWGTEAEEFAGQLEVVLGYFILSFGEPDSEKVQQFWGKIAHRESQGSGVTRLSGWITAFCFWTEDGKRPESFGMGSDKAVCYLESPRPGAEGSSFSPVDMMNIPVGYVSVPVKVIDNGKEYKTEMLAGSIGVSVTSSGDCLDESVVHYHPRRYHASRHRNDDLLGPSVEDEIETKVGDKKGLDTIQPVTGWWMYIV